MQKNSILEKLLLLLLIAAITTDASASEENEKTNGSYVYQENYINAVIHGNGNVHASIDSQANIDSNGASHIYQQNFINAIIYGNGNIYANVNSYVNVFSKDCKCGKGHDHKNGNHDCPNPKPTPTATIAPTPSPTKTPVPTVTMPPQPTAPKPTPTATPNPTSQPTASPEPTVTPELTITPQPAPTVTSEPTPEPTPAETTPAPTPVETTPVPTATPIATSTPTASPEPTVEPTPIVTSTPEKNPDNEKKMMRASSGSIASSGCGRDVQTKEPFSNMRKHESREEFVNIYKQEINYNFTTLEFLKGVSFKAKTNENCVSAQGELLKERSSNVKVFDDNLSVVYFDVWVGSNGYSDSDKKVQNKSIRFAIPKEFAGEVSLMFFQSGSWIEVPFERFGENYRANVTGFGYYALKEKPIFRKIVSNVTLSEPSIINPGKEKKVENFPKSSNLGTIIAAIALIVLLVAGLMSRKSGK